MIKYRRDIDGLRAIAVIPVIFMHAGSQLFSGGYVGVDIFFVISGYLITFILLRENANDNFSFNKFWLRRVRRIFPLFFVVLLVTSVSFSLISTPEALIHYSKSLIYQTFFSGNIFFWKDINYFSTLSEQFPLLHTWSLAVEEQFYFIFPFVLYGLVKFSKRSQFLALLSLVLLSLFLCVFFTQRMPAASFYLLPFRAWEIGLGSLVAWLHFTGNHLSDSKKMDELFAWFGISLIGYSIFSFDKETLFPSYNALIPTLGAALLIDSGFRTQTKIAKILSHKIFVSVGLISYSLYLWHWPILVYIRQFQLETPTMTQLAIGIFICFIFSIITYFFVEEPFRKNRTFFTTKKLMTFFVFGLGVSSLYFLSVIQTNGFAFRLSKDYVNYVENTQKDSRYFECKELYCSIGTNDNRIFVWGDSHAASLMPGIVKAANEQNVQVDYAIMNACPGLPGVVMSGESSIHNQNCYSKNIHVLNYLKHTKYKKIFMVSRFNIYLNKRDLFGRKSKKNKFIYWKEDGPNTEDRESTAIKTFEKSLKLLSETLPEKSLIFIKQVPNFNISPPEYANRYQVLKGYNVSYLRPRKEISDRSKKFLASIRKYNFPLLSLDEEFCDKDYCRPYRDGKSLYFDDSHLSVYGSESLIDSFRFLGSK